jgi:hypothetical protein
LELLIKQPKSSQNENSQTAKKNLKKLQKKVTHKLRPPGEPLSAAHGSGEGWDELESIGASCKLM